MKKQVRWLSFVICTMVLGIAVAATSQPATTPTTNVTPTAVGTWQTIDDVTHNPRSLVFITVDQGQLTGKLIKINYRPGEGPGDVCAKCSGSLHNQKILGMTILSGMKQDPVNPLVWKGGRIVDPESGRSYDCKITLADDGNSMKVRGFIGFSLLGRTQNWYKQ